MNRSVSRLPAGTTNKVSFNYDGDDKPVLSDVTTTFEAQKSYAIVGASGSGKSTLLHLLMASTHDYEGNILYDNHEIKDISTESLYDITSLVQQNVFVFNSSIRDNITLFRDFDEQEINEAIELSGLSSLIAERGSDYLCGENGIGFSGGERQRISIARALLRKTPPYLF
ncbi:MAG: ABC transporter ATP-binding protein [Acholeplasmataceae bacterium]|jgi:ABC-type multidrug transport system fused ATPase/permease subunit